MGIIIQIWIRQYIRNFRWVRALETLCVLVMVLLTLAVMYFLFEDDVSISMITCDFSLVVPYLAFIMLIPDFLVKILWKKDSIIMNDFLKTRPVENGYWNIFIFLVNLIDFWNWLSLFFLIPLSFITMSVQRAFIASFLFFVASLTNGFAVSILHGTQGWKNKIPVLFTEGLGLLFAAFYSLNVFHLSWNIHIMGFILLFALIFFLLYIYNSTICHYTAYSWNMRKTYNSGGFLFSMLSVAGILRSKKLIPNMLFPLFFIPQLLSSESEYVSAYMVYFNISCFLSAASLLMGNMMLGIESNFMDGLWTRPCELKKILRNIYCFYAILCIIYAVILLMLLFGIQKISLYFIFVELIFVIGVVNLTIFINIFSSNRLDLFKFSFFNNQGCSMSLTLSNLITVIPLITELILLFFMPFTISCIVIGCSGFLGIFFHRFILNWFAKKYIRNRYKHFERYRN